MPKRTDIHSILVLGAGPIVIGQACEFDYSGSQAVKALKREGYRIVLVNSNPATIMTDPELADATYVEPLTPEIVSQIIARERPDALLPTVGGQTALNLAVSLASDGVLERYGIELIGASLRAMQLAEDRQLFKEAMERIGLECPRSGLATTLEEARAVAEAIGRFPLLIRPSFTLGGSGGGMAENEGDFVEMVEHGLRLSPVGSVLIEESVLGWKEFELEVMRDGNDNFVVVCSIENLDPMGIHTGDSITVAPAQTLTDKEYQRLRDQARRVMSAVGVETGGSNVQFAVDPATGRVLVIEMNPRVSRSSALASKATGFPIAKIAALLAVGYTLDELQNDITRETVAAFEPSLDYVVVKLPRWAFEKFPGVDPTLGPQMKSVGEAMAIGRTFKEAFNKGFRSLEIGLSGWHGHAPARTRPRAEIEKLLRLPNRDRLPAVHDALWQEWPEDAICQATGFDPWFVRQLAQIVALEREIHASDLSTLSPGLLRKAKRYGLSDSRIAELLGDVSQATAVRSLRTRYGILPTYARVDTCAAEFEAYTPYLYATYEEEDEAAPADTPKVIILGGGPNRIGQGIEFDYCCCHAAFALQEMGYQAIMVNCNPETVSTDYDTSDRLYFEPLTLEDVLNIVEVESGIRLEAGKKFPANTSLHGVIVQFGGQTPLNLARGLAQAGVPILGTSPDAIDLAEDRGRFGALLAELDIPCPANGIAYNPAEALAIARQIGYPVVVRPSYVLGGRAMAIVDNEKALTDYMNEATAAAEGRAILIDQFLEDAYEVDVDAICDGEQVVIGGVMQHIEEAGIHSGDSACVLPPYKVSYYHLSIIRDYTTRLGLALNVRGLMNVQYAIKDDVVYVLEVNPRASRTVPFVSKATGVPLARIATQVMAGRTLAELGWTAEPQVDGFFVKEAVLPFIKFPEADTVLGPEMRSTGEVMGHAPRFGQAFAKAQMAAGSTLPQAGGVLVTVNDFDKGAALKIARDLWRLGFELYGTPGTAQFLTRAGLPVTVLAKAVAGEQAYTTLDAMRDGKIQMIINTPLGPESRADGARIRRLATRLDIPLFTTLSAAQAAVSGIRILREKALRVRSLQEHYAAGRPAPTSRQQVP
ncbi:MAG: carbamoyl-phosphate synthase large subunit [Caldilineae bacterium]|nr:MAG: carbamoyl-phosphate synthase large subunit [Caldilineae bacterium]